MLSRTAIISFFRLTLLSGVLLAINVLAAEVPALVGQAQQLLASDNADGAYTLLLDNESEHAGNIEFDYWLGVTANRSGHHTRALFALDRVLIQQPNHAAARLERATAYTQLRQNEAAELDLAYLEQLSPPAAARQHISTLRNQLGFVDTASRRENRLGYVTVEGGYDDNPGSWPSDLGPFGTINEANSAFAALSAGYRQRVDMAANQSLQFSVNGLLRRYEQDEAEQFDQDFLTGALQWSRLLDGRRSISAGVDGGTLQLDGDAFYHFYGVNGELRQQLDDRTRISAQLGFRDLQFDNDAFDYRLSRIGSSVQRQLSSRWSLNGDLYLEYEAARRNRVGGDAARVGVVFGSSWRYSRQHRFDGSLTYERSEYRSTVGVNEALNLVADDRDDDRLLLALSWRWDMGQSWQLNSRAQYRDQSSTLDLYDFDQVVVSTALTRFF